MVFACFFHDCGMLMQHSWDVVGLCPFGNCRTVYSGMLSEVEGSVCDSSMLSVSGFRGGIILCFELMLRREEHFDRYFSKIYGDRIDTDMVCTGACVSLFA